MSKGGDLIQPLGLTLAPNGDILATNAGNVTDLGYSVQIPDASHLSALTPSV